MTRKPNFAKFILGATVLALLFIGTWATTHAPRTSAANGNMLGAAAAVPSPTPTPAPPGPPPGVLAVFEAGDGNAVDPVEGPLPDDWNFVNPAAGTAPQTQVAGDGNAEVATFIDDTGDADQIFTQGGSKDFNDVQPNWMHTTGSVPDKDEITHAYAARYVVPDTPDTNCTTGNCTVGHQVLVFGGDRFATNGDANIGFWFFQNPIGTPANGTFTGFHMDGDIFILSAFTGGGGTSTIRVLEWVGTHQNANANYCSAAPPAGLGGFIDPASDTGDFPNGSLCDITATTTNPGASIVNAAPKSLDWPYSTKGQKTPCTNTPIIGGTFGSGPGCTVPTGAFYEGGIDLTALNVPGTECFSTFMLETRSSQSVDAVLKDFALGSFQQCGLSCSKIAVPETVCEGSSTTYAYTAGNPNSPVSISVSLIDDNETATTSDDIDVIASDAAGHDVTVASEGGTPQTVSIAPGGTAGPYHRTVTPSLAGSPHINTLTVHATNQTGVPDCVTTATVTVVQRPSVTVNSPSACAGGSATITATPSPADTGGTYTYAWSGPFDVNHPNPGNVPSFSAFNGGNYTVTITDANGCTGQGTGTLAINPNPVVTIGTAACSTGDSIGLLATATVNGNACTNCTFVWTKPDNSTFSTGADPNGQSTLPVTTPGTYSVVASQPHSGGAPSCTGSTSKHVGLCY